MSEDDDPRAIALLTGLLLFLAALTAALCCGLGQLIWTTFVD